MNKLLKVSGSRSKSINMAKAGAAISTDNIEVSADVPVGVVQLK